MYYRNLFDTASKMKELLGAESYNDKNTGLMKMNAENVSFNYRKKIQIFFF